MKLCDLLKHLDTIAPLRLAESWDNVGLLLGDPEAEIARVLTCLTVTPAVAREAVETGAQLIVAHHPILFRGAKAIRADVPGTDVVWTLARAGIAVASHHTGWDGARGGANDFLAETLKLEAVVPLKPSAGPECVKFVVFVPDENLEAVRDAAFRAGAGQIGLYDECSFTMEGHGTFRASVGADPAIGEIGRRESVPERRLEVICRKSQRSAVMQAIRAAHMYEEPAVDVYPLAEVASAGTDGVGRIGSATNEASLRSLAELAKAGLGSAAVQVAVAEGRSVDDPANRVALACGAGDDLIEHALAAGADVLVSGELRYHGICRAIQAGLSVILVGHHASERMSMEVMARKIQECAEGIEARAAQAEPEPLMNFEGLE